MKKDRKLPFFSLLIIVATSLCGCPPLEHKIYIRNTTNDTARLTLQYQTENVVDKPTVDVRYTDAVIEISNKTLPNLNRKMVAVGNNNEVKLPIPPKSTLFLSDVINSFYRHGARNMIIIQANLADTFQFVYPYRGLENFKRKRDKSYNYFYRTIIWHDIE
ncbi:MAG: hypothetical protein JWR72_352 [Flavisolibacter sp.]|nr:hypothetical protein [Flavisolibacter sp.]